MYFTGYVFALAAWLTTRGRRRELKLGSMLRVILGSDLER